MGPINYNVKIDLMGSANAPRIEFTKGDIGSKFISFSVFTNNKPEPLIDKTITVTIKKTDNVNVIYDIPPSNIHDNVADFYPDINAINVPGTVLFTFEVYDGISRITSKRMQYTVTDSLNVDDDVASFKDYPILTRLISDVRSLDAAEALRKEDELTRATNENTRIDNELARQQNETERVAELNSIKDAYDAATKENTILEVMNARKGEVDLPTKIGKIDSSLNDIANSQITGTSGKKYKIVAGTVRNSGSGWQFITDTDHGANLNCDSVSADANNLTINYASINAQKIISFVIAPDESFASMGYFCGASVGKTLASVQIYKSVPKGVGGIATCNTSQFTLSNNIGITGLTWNSDGNYRLRISHTNLSSTYEGSYSGAPNIRPYSSGKFIPRIWAVYGAAVDVEFYDFTGNKITTLSDQLSFIFNRQTMEQNTTQKIDPSALVSASGNFWFMGIFEV